MQGRWSLWSTEKLRRIPWKVRFETLQTIVTISYLALEKSDIVDTNGAGDAFVGGFLAQWVLGNVSGDSSPLLSSLLYLQGLDLSVKCGIWAARHCIQRSGCTMPDICDFK